MSKESEKIINSLFKTVLSHLNDGIRNALENSEISREITHNEATGTNNYAFHVSFGGKKLIDGKVENIEFDVQNDVLIAYRGQNKEVIIPNTVHEIGPKAFAGKLIQSIEIPDSVTTIGDAAFHDCFMLETILFGNGLKHIGNSAFEGCSELAEANLPDSIVKIGKRAFAEDWSLEKIHLPLHLSELPDELFNGCRILDEIEWPENLQTIGKNIFEDCFDPDLWGYFSIQDGICTRQTANREMLDPEGLFTLNASYYSQSQANKLLNWIWRNAAFVQTQIDQCMELSRYAMKLTAVITDCDIYAAMQTARLCLDYLQSNEANDISDQDYKTITQKIFETICGNGESLRQTDMQIRDSILENEDPSDATVQEIADKCFISLMNELEIGLTPNRYHPSIYHYGARYIEGDSYWQFVTSLEGLLRFNGYNITQCEVLCDHEDSLDDWICAWSKSIISTDFSIIRIDFSEENNSSIHWLLLLDWDRTVTLHDMFENQGFSNVMTGWQSGKKLFALTMI